MVPFRAHAQEVRDLCASINHHHKFDKIGRKLRANLGEIEGERRKVMDAKLSEREELEEAIATIR